MPFPGISGMWPQATPYTVERARTFNATYPAGGMTVCSIFFGLGTSSFTRSAVRITNNSTTLSLTLNAVFMGPKAATGAPYSFASTPTALTFNGNQSVTIAAGGTVTSDELINVVPSTNTVLAANVSGNTPTSQTIGFVGSLPVAQNVTYVSYIGPEGCSVASTDRNASTAVITLTSSVNHNLALNDPLYFGGGTFEYGIANNTIYYAIPVTNQAKQFRISTTVGGSPLLLNGNPTRTGTVFICPQTAGVVSKAANYPTISSGSGTSNGTQAIFSALLVRAGA